MTAYPSEYQLGDNHAFFDPSSRPIHSSIEQRVDIHPHEAGDGDTVPRSTPRYFSPPDMTTSTLGHSQRYSDDNSNRRTAVSTGGEYYDDGDEGYGLHYYYGKTWDSRTSEPVKEVDARAQPARTTTTTNSSAEWSADSPHRSLPYNQIPLHRPPEIYEPSIRQATTLGVVGHSQESHSGARMGSYPSLQSNNGSAEPMPEYPMSRLSRLPAQGVLTFFRNNVINPHVHPCPHPHSRQLMFYQPTQEELDERAHQPVPPEKLSTYSELSPHIEFMQRLKYEEALEKENESRKLARNSMMIISSSSPISSDTRPFNVNSTATTAPTITTAIATANSMACPGAGLAHGAQVISQTSTLPTPMPSQADSSSAFVPPPAKKRRWGKHATANSTRPRPPGAMEVDQAATHGATTGNSSSSPELESRSTASAAIGISATSSNGVKYIKSDPRKPSLACTFCRERKISCGRPPAGNKDQTCNQCARRSFKCEYLTELPGPSNPKSTARRRRRSSLVAISPPKSK